MTLHDDLDAARGSAASAMMRSMRRLKDMASEPQTTIELERAHEWDAGSPWGIIFGVSRCKLCGVISTVANLDARDCVAAILQEHQR